MPDDNAELEADLDKALTDTANPVESPEAGVEAPSGQPTQDGEGEVYAEVAGRKFKTKEELLRTFDSNYRGYNKLEKEKKELAGRYEQWRNYDETLKKDPGRHKAIVEAEKKYLDELAKGATKPEAQAASGLDAASKQRIDQLEQWKSERQERDDAESFEKEETTFRSAHPEITPEQMQKVYAVQHEALDGGKGFWMEFEKAWKYVRIDELDVKNGQLKTTIDRVKADADLGGSQHGGAPAGKSKTTNDVVRHGTEAEYEALLDKQLGGG
jgi:hypothetical protein